MTLVTSDNTTLKSRAARKPSSQKPGQCKAAPIGQKYDYGIDDE